MHDRVRLYQQKQRETGVFFWNYAIKMRAIYHITNRQSGRIANLERRDWKGASIVSYMNVHYRKRKYWRLKQNLIWI